MSSEELIDALAELEQTAASYSNEELSKLKQALESALESISRIFGDRAWNE